MESFKEMFLESYLSDLVWTLIHSLWQGLVVALLLFTIYQILGKRISANTRYVMGLIAMAIVLGWSTNTFINLTETSSTPISDSTIFNETILFAKSFEVSAPRGLINRASTLIESNVTWIGLVWAIGFMAMILKVIGSRFYLSTLRNNANDPNQKVIAIVKSVASRLNIKKDWIVMESTAVRSPIVFGHFRPLMLLPVGIANELSVNQLKAVVAHEFAHIRRNDYLINLFQSIVECIYFFNPFLVWMSAQVRAEREYVCDEFAVKYIGSGFQYSETLLKLGELNLRDSESLSLGAMKNGKKSLFDRIKRIMKIEMKPKSNANALVPLILIVAMLIYPSYSLFSSKPEKQDSNENSLEKLIELNQSSLGTDLERMQVEFNTLENIEENRTLKTKSQVIQDLNLDLHKSAKLNLLSQSYLNKVKVSLSDTIPDEIETEELKRRNKELEKSMEDMKKQMEELGRRFEAMEFDSRKWEEEISLRVEQAMRGYQEAMENIDWSDMDFEGLEELEHLKELQSFKFNFDFNDDWEDNLRESLEAMQENLENLPDMEALSERIEEQWSEHFKKFEEFQQDLEEFLIENDYIDEGEDIESLRIKDDEVRINDKLLSPEDAKKVIKMREEYFKDLDWDLDLNFNFKGN